MGVVESGHARVTRNLNDVICLGVLAHEGRRVHGWLDARRRLRLVPKGEGSGAMSQGAEIVPFVDVARQHQRVAGDLEAAFARVVAHGGFTLGPEVSDFEQAFARFVGTEESVGVASGTDALHFALRACGVGAGDEVVVPANTFAATAEAVVMAGARPVFVDIDPRTYLMDLDALQSAITPKTTAVIPVHLYGQCVDMRRVNEIAKAHGVRVIEDACQAHGASRDGLAAGSAGDAAAFSFYPSKNLGALGDGGAVTTNDPEIAKRVRSLRNHGEDGRRLHTEVGYCSRLHSLQAALLGVKLTHLAEWNESRRRSAAFYAEKLAGTGIEPPLAVDGATHVYHVYVVRVPDRELFREVLARSGIQTGVHYAVPLHLEPAFADLGFERGDFPQAERAAKEIVSLPMFPYLQEAEISRVVEAVGQAGHD
jgi:dTDP-4-amino-4,6-dideoxygalactose transaminase